MSPNRLDARGLSQVRGLVDGRLVPAVDRFRMLQDRRGRVTDRLDEARALLGGLTHDLEDVCRLTGQQAFAGAFASSAARWQTAGLDTPPDFAAVRSAYRPGDDGEATVLLAPITTTNGASPTGARLECCLTLVEVPPEARDLAAGLACRFGRLLTGSAGYVRGNCVVCFSEQVAAADPDPRQHFALFLMNKFQRIYQRETLPVARALLGDAGPLTGARGWASDGLSPASYYAARCVWAAAHETYHQQGPRPLRDNLALKLNWFCGLLEEVKVDVRVALAAAGGRLPDADVVAEFVLLDRMFRYPRHPTATRNFDAGTGVLMFEHLAGAGAVRPRDGGGLDLDAAACFAALAELADAIERLETLPDDVYRAGAEAFVRTLLHAGNPGERFRFPQRYARWVRPAPTGEILSFDSLPY